MERHLKRQELIQAARHGGADFADHLDRCTDCADAVALLQRYSVAGRIRLPDAPVGWIENAVRLAHETSVLGRATSLVARLVFDSWLMPQPVGVRGEGLSNDRRVRFENDLVTFDLRAERERKNWSFVAHISGSPGVDINKNRGTPRLDDRLSGRNETERSCDDLSFKAQGR